MGCLIPHASMSLSTLRRASVPSQVKRVAFLGVGTTVHHSQCASTGPRAQGHSWERGTVLLLGKKIKQRKMCVTGGLGSPQERPEQGCVWEGKVCLLPKLRGMVWHLHRLPQLWSWGSIFQRAGQPKKLCLKENLSVSKC